MKKSRHSRDGASKGAAPIIVLAFVVLATALSPANLSAKPSPTPTAAPSPTPSPSPSPSPSPTPGCASIVSAAIASPGNFYAVGDKLYPAYGTLCAPADNYGFSLSVSSVDSNGHVTGVIIIPGIGYSVLPSNPVGFGGSATGIGFTANCTFR